METVRRTPLSVALIGQMMIFVIMMRASWQKDRQKQMNTTTQSLVVASLTIVLLVLHPTTGSGSRIILGGVLILFVSSIILNVRPSKNRSRRDPRAR